MTFFNKEAAGYVQEATAESQTAIEISPRLMADFTDVKLNF
jgi:hypothetical protein